MNTNEIILKHILESEIGGGSMLARRIDPRTLPKPQTPQQKMGLRYERNVIKALRNRGFDVEHNPWFGYKRVNYCCVDAIIYELCQNRVIVVEVKLTYTPRALEKLKKIYCPVVKEVTKLKVFPVVICKNLTLGNSVEPRNFYDVIGSNNPVYQWLGLGPII